MVFVMMITIMAELIVIVRVVGVLVVVAVVEKVVGDGWGGIDDG